MYITDIEELISNIDFRVGSSCNKGIGWHGPTDLTVRRYFEYLLRIG